MWEFFRCLLLAHDVPIFKSLHREEKIEIMKTMDTRLYAPGSPIVTQGEVRRSPVRALISWTSFFL